MEIWLDTTDCTTIELGHKMGILHGVTTNPSLILESGKNLETVLEEVLSHQNGPVTAQVTSPDHTTIVEQAENLREFDERVIPKIPVTQEGLKAMSALSHLHFPLMATTIFSPTQALLACQAGAQLIAPYFSHIKNPIETLESILFMIERYTFESKVVVASFKTVEQVYECLELGVDAVTLKKEIFEQFIADQPNTFERLEQFSRDWKKAKPSNLLS